MDQLRCASTEATERLGILVLPSPDLRVLSLFIWTICAVPFLVGTFIMALASSSGAEGVVSLTQGRHLLATTTGIVLGGLCLVGSLLIGALWIESATWLVLFSFLAPGLACVLAYQSAKIVSVRLARYRCKVCGVRYFSRFAKDRCDFHAEELDGHARRLDDRGS